MGRHALDPNLSLLARRLDEVELPAYDSLITRTTFKNCYLLPNMKTWVVRLFLGGANRCLGFTSDQEKAMKFADLALNHFWKYRQRGARPPVDADLNTDCDWVRLAIESSPEALELLHDLEAHLIETGAILTSEQLAFARLQRQNVKKLGRSNRGENIQMHGETQALVAGVTKKIEELCKQIELLAATIEGLRQNQATANQVLANLAARAVAADSKKEAAA